MRTSNPAPTIENRRFPEYFQSGSVGYLSRWVSRARVLPRLALVMMAGVLGLALAGCGGDGGGTTSPTTLPLMEDSFGNLVPEAGFGGGDGGAAGADGSAGDGVPIPNAPVTIVDSVGKSVTTRTDALGYYRLRIDGLTPPLIARVTNEKTGVIWYSPSVSPVIAREFTTINLTGLTDKVASDVAAKAGRTGAAQLTPAILSANPKALQDAKAQLNADLSKQITAAGLNPSTFDPVGTPFRAVLVDPYDKLLESVQIVKAPDGTTLVDPIYSLGGSIGGLGSRPGLSLGLGTETLVVSAGSTTFTFVTQVKKGSSYSVVVRSQPAGSNCAVTNGSGVMAEAAVTNVTIACDYVLGGSITGLGNASGLVLSNGGENLSIPPASTASFVFTNSLLLGSTYSVKVTANPDGHTCSVSNGSGTVTGSSVNNVVVVTCFPSQYTLGGEITGLTSAGLVLANGNQTLPVDANATNFVFETNLVSGTSYNVVVAVNPTGLTCGVSKGSGRVTNAPIQDVLVSCLPLSF